jgi:hypothetical protein
MEGYAARAPEGWIEYYCSVAPGRNRSQEVLAYDNRVKLTTNGASIYYTTAIGSGFLVWQAIRYLLDLPIHTMQMIDLIEEKIYQLNVQTNQECRLCA